jgi:hypothetical protein
LGSGFRGSSFGFRVDIRAYIRVCIRVYIRVNGYGCRVDMRVSGFGLRVRVSGVGSGGHMTPARMFIAEEYSRG